MAQLLYRIGAFSARRARLVVSAWLVIMVAAAGAFLAFGGTFQSSFSIPGTETDRVTSELADNSPDAAGATGFVTFATDDGSEFTAHQEAQIAWLLHRMAQIDGVASTVDPFEAQAERAEQEQQLADGAIQLADAKEQLDAAQAELDAARAELDEGRESLNAAISAARATGTLWAFESRFAEQQAQIDEGAAQIEEGAAQIADGRAEVAEQAPILAHGRTLQDAASEIRTVSTSANAAIAFVTFDQDALDLPAELKATVADELDTANIDGVEVGYSSVIGSSVSGIMGIGEVVGFAIAAIVLLVMLRALLPALVPLASSILGVAVGVTGALAFSDVVAMDSVTPVLGVMLGLAVGIDYSLFILHRHRKQVLAGSSVGTSLPLANGTAGNAVVFAGSTVIVALLALSVTGIPFLSVMGVVAAACVAVAVLVSVTFTPAVLSLMGERVLGRKARASIGDSSHTPAAPRAMSTRRAVISGIAGTVLLAIIALPALSMRLGLPDGSSEEPDSPQYRSYSVIAQDFGEGMNGPLLVVATMPEPVADADVLGEQAEIAGLLMAQQDVVAVAPISVLDDGRILTFQLIPAEGPSSESTEALVAHLRTMPALGGDVTLGIAGQASGNIDISAKLADALPLYLAVVVGLSMIILVLVFRSLLVPVIATGGFVLSLFAALGAMTAVYQWGWLGGVFGVHDPGPVLSFAPILIMGVLFGLAMDYQLFLVSGMREAYVHGTPARAAVMSGLKAGRAVVTAAAIIMIAVFGGFVFSHLGMVRPLGFGLAIGVLFDAFVVRMVLVPSAMHLLGDKAWWIPRWLDRIMPNVDVEGAALERTHPLHAQDNEPLLIGSGAPR